MHEREWAELGQIDYFLEQLARAVERGEVPRSSYDMLAPRYLERRGELAAIIAGAARQRPADAGVPPGPQQAPVARQEPVARAERSPAASAPAAGARGTGAPAASQFSWTTALLVTGAFLVIVAAAVFAIAAWQRVGWPVRFAFLGAVTLAFYAAGDRVRAKLGSNVGGAALTVVASAMLLFDGWIIIDGYGLGGPIPWAVWMLLCSAVYWYTEVRLAGGFFGVVGAAAQIAWWWLLTDGLGWDASPRLAVIAVVTAVWSVVAARAPEGSSVTPIARVLRVVAPVTGVVVALAFVSGSLVDGRPDLGTLLLACAVGWSFTVTVESLELPRPVVAVGHLPVVVLLASVEYGSWLLAGVLVALAALYATYELLRGGIAHGALGLVAEIGVVFSLAVALEWSQAGQLLALAVLGVSWGGASVLLKRASCHDDGRVEDLAAYALVAEVGTWLLLVALTVALPSVIGPPLVMWDVTWFETFVATALAAAWFGCALLLKRPGALGSALVSVFALACLLDTARLDWDASLVGLPFLALAGAWSAAAAFVERVTDLRRKVTRIAMRAFVPVVALVALLVDAWYDALPSWQGALLLAVLTAWFLVDALPTDDAGLRTAAGVTAVGAAAMTGGWLAHGAGAAVAGAAAGAAIAAAGLALRARRRSRDWWPASAAAAGLLASFFAYNDAPALGIAFALSALACACAAEAMRVREGHFFAGLSGAGALWAFIADAAPEPWVTVVLTAAYGFALLVPAAAFDRSRPDGAGRAVRALAVAGGVATLVPVLLGIGPGAFGQATREWWAVSGWAWAGALLALGAYLLAVAHLFDAGPLVFGGVAALVFAYWAALGEGDVQRIEWYTMAAGAYVAWAGYRAARSAGPGILAVTDLVSAAIVLGVPALALLGPGLPDAVSWEHTFWAFGLGVLAIGAGIWLRARAYFFGGIATLVWTSVVRSWTYLVEYWWVVLGVVGTGMIVVALAREQRRAVLDDVRDKLGGWR